jgi:hypothetical protein
MEGKYALALAFADPDVGCWYIQDQRTTAAFALPLLAPRLIKADNRPRESHDFMKASNCCSTAVPK